MVGKEMMDEVGSYWHHSTNLVHVCGIEGLTRSNMILTFASQSRSVNTVSYQRRHYIYRLFTHVCIINKMRTFTLEKITLAGNIMHTVHAR